MQLIFRGKNITITEALKDYLAKKLGKLDKYFEDTQEVQVTLVVERERHGVEVTIPVNGYIIRGEEQTGDMYASIDLVIDKLERQLEKYKTRLARKLRQVSLRELVAQGPTVEYEEPQLVRTKRFAIKPMPIEEAILQMNLLGHSFFVFSNAENEEVNVVYRRKDGNYGLIERER